MMNTTQAIRKRTLPININVSRALMLEMMKRDDSVDHRTRVRAIELEIQKIKDKY